ncbi:sigma factor-like helix-turn-helix DNA-binding protein [Methylorubrum rhodesianum]|uniref:sigma factor-like helix-turn-helix DNA-binding protein n=1 Tax=Methylorubrum rhodesianum TaxID=29427 RepID=UPI003CFF3FD4
MPAPRLLMRHLRDLLRLRLANGLSQEAIARSLGLGQGTVSNYFRRARRAGLTAWPLPEDLDDARLEVLLFPSPPDLPADERPRPDWGEVHRELRRPDVTLTLLWEE